LNQTDDPVLIVAFGEEENLGVGYLISVLKEAGIEASMIDFRQNDEDILTAIRRRNPFVVGFSLIFEVYIGEFARLITFLRKNGISCHFTAGGYYSSLHPDEILSLMPGLDSIVRFEGEYTFRELAGCICKNEDWRSVRNLSFRENGRIVSTPLRDPEKDIDIFPFPSRGRPEEYAKGRTYTAIIAARGCSYDCSFCNTREFYRKARGPLRRIRKPESVAGEMKKLFTETGCTVLLFQDDDFPVRAYDGAWINTFCSEIENTGLAGRIAWKTNCRPDEIDRDTFLMMKKHGLYLVFTGLEDGTDEGLRRLNKRTTAEKGLEGVGILRELDIGFDFGFMLFQPETSFGSLRENLSYLERVCRDGYTPVSFLRLLPYFDTQVEKDLREQGRIRGAPGSLDYNFRTGSLDACWSAVGDCFAEWLWGRKGFVNLARWVRNYLAVGDFFNGQHSVHSGYRQRYLDTVTLGNLWLSENLKDLFSYYESGDYLNDGGTQKEQIRIYAESMNRQLSKSLRKMLKKLEAP